MAAARLPSVRANIAILAAAALVLIGAFIAWRTAPAPATSPTLATQPPRPPVPAQSAAPRKPARAPTPVARAEPAPKPVAAAEKTVHDEPADARERERLAFVRRLNTADARRMLGPGVPLAVSELVGAGRLREAVNELLQMGRDGDANGYAALEQWLRICPAPVEDRAFEQRGLEVKARSQQMIDRMASAGASGALLDRLQWSLDAINSHIRGTWAEFCPSRETGDYRSLLGEVHRVLPGQTPSKYEDQLRNAASTGSRPAPGIREAYEGESTEHARRRAEMGVMAAQVQLARRDLLGGDPAQKAAAFDVARSLAPLSLEAHDALATCAWLRCTAEARDPERARQLVLEAARAGSVDALGMLETRIKPIVEDSAERYAWSQVRHELHEQGCFGFSRFSTWAFTHALKRDAALLDMSPHEAEMAKRRAAEMIATEVPRIRAQLGCDDD